MRPPDITCSGVVRIWIWMSCSRGHQPTGRTNDFISAFDAAQQPRLVSLGHICLADMHSCRNQRDNRTAQQMTTYVRDCPRSCTSHRGPSTKATIPFHEVFVKPVAESNSRPVSTKRMHQLSAGWPQQSESKKTRETKRNKWSLSSHTTVRTRFAIVHNPRARLDQARREKRLLVTDDPEMRITFP